MTNKQTSDEFHTVEVSCASCRSSEYFCGQHGVWVHICSRGKQPNRDSISPCEEWCPPKSDVRTWIERMKINK